MSIPSGGRFSENSAIARQCPDVFAMTSARTRYGISARGCMMAGSGKGDHLMALDIGDLDGKIKLFETAAETWLATIPDFDQDDLDELVIDTLSEEASKAVNAGAGFEASHGEAEAIASEINNGGPRRQVAALLALGWKIDDVAGRLEVEVAPAP
jgi:hypothetical protein